MTVLILTMGTRGDVQPYVALGRGLTGAGHEVTVAASPRFEAFVRDHGLGFSPLSDSMLKLMDTAEGRGALEDMGSLISGIRTGLSLLRKAGTIQRELVEDGWAVAQQLRPDVILYNTKMACAPHYAEKLGIPVALAVLFPQFVPTTAFPTVGFPLWSLGGAYNRLTYAVVLRIADWIGRKHFRAWRAVNGLPTPRGRTDVLHRSDGSHLPVLHGYSEHVVPRPADWPPEAVVTGYWFLQRADTWKPSPSLEAFLNAGSPPVYVGFGSMAGRYPERTTRVVVEALRRTGLRGILATGWGGLEGDVPDTIFRLEAAPHDWLFPRCAAVVHHGGAGTTAAGLRAGKPTVICPFFGDQPFWGWRMHSLGVGSPPIPQKRLTADRLAEALHLVTADPAIRRRAEALGTRIRNEVGIANGVAAVEALVADYHPVGATS